jgi:hypothetical protein
MNSHIKKKLLLVFSALFMLPFLAKSQQLQSAWSYYYSPKGEIKKTMDVPFGGTTLKPLGYSDYENVMSCDELDAARVEAVKQVGSQVLGELGGEALSLIDVGEIAQTTAYAMEGDNKAAAKSACRGLVGGWAGFVAAGAYALVASNPVTLTGFLIGAGASYGAKKIVDYAFDSGVQQTLNKDIVGPQCSVEAISRLLAMKKQMGNKQFNQYKQNIKKTVVSDPAVVSNPTVPKGKKNLVVDLPTCKYWVAGLPDCPVISGYYLTKDNEKVNYTSLPLADYFGESIKNYKPIMLVTSGGTGYHIYWSVQEYKTKKWIYQDPQNKGQYMPATILKSNMPPAFYKDKTFVTPYMIINRMRGKDSTIIHKIPWGCSAPDGNFLIPAKDLSTYTIRYANSLNPSVVKTLTLD